MAKKQIVVERLSYGLYSGWKAAGKELPKIRQHTWSIPACEGIEFGYILRICKARRCTLTFTIEHPPFTGEDGKVLPAFEGSEIIPANIYTFFLGDSIWAPVEEKLGDWRLITRIDDEIVADETFHIVADEDHNFP